MHLGPPNTGFRRCFIKAVASFLGVLLLPALARASLPENSSEHAPTDPGLEQAQPELKQVLLLHSYHNGLSWTDEVTQGVLEAFSQRTDCDVDIVHFDTKRFPLEPVNHLFLELIRERYGHGRTDVVIACDNHALEWLNQHANAVLPGVPIVFCGINDYDPAIHAALSQVTGVTEDPFLLETYTLIRRLQPDLKRLVVVSDQTPTGLLALERIRREIGEAVWDLDLEVWQDVSLDVLKSRLAHLDPETDAVFLGVFTQDTHGNWLDYEEAAEQITAAATAPVYGMWKFYMNHGVVGGYLISSQQHGAQAAGLALSILDGTSAATIPVARAKLPAPTLDYSALERYGLDLSHLSEQPILLNPPDSWFRENRLLVIAVLTLMVLEALLIGGLVYVWLRGRRQAARQRREFGMHVPGLLFEYEYVPSTDQVKVHYISDGTRKLFGAAPEEVMQDSEGIFRSVHPDDTERVRTAIRDNSLDLKPRRQRYRTCPAPDTILWVETYATPERRTDGTIIWHGFIADVTEAVEAQQELQSANERFLIATAAANCGIWEYDLKAKHLNWDDRMFDLYGVAKATFNHSFDDWSARVHPDDLQTTIDLFDQAVASDTHYETEFRIRRHDGQQRIIKAHGKRVQSQDGKTAKFIGLNYDVTAQRADERTNRTLASIVENSHDAILIKDLDCRVIATNRAFARLTGQPSIEAIIGKTETEILGLETDSERARNLHLDERTAQQLPAGESISRQDTFTRPDGKDIHLLIRKFPIFDAQEKRIGTGTISADVTLLAARSQELEASNAQLEKAIAHANQMALQAGAADQAKSAFLATMSHEIRTPLNSIVGLAEVLTSTPLNLEQIDYLRTIRASSDILLSLINDILDYSKIEAGSMHLEHISFELCPVVDECVQILAARAHRKGIRLAVSMSPETPGHVRGDPVRLRQILLNLLSNAIKFTEAGEVRLSLQGRRTGYNDAELVFSVRDTGIGMSAEVMGNLFQPFQQGDATVTRRFGGTGLGLVISKRLAQQMKGDISVESTKGLGSCFTARVRLPLGEQNTALYETIPGPRFRGKRIVILTDDEADSAHFAGLAEAWGMEATIQWSEGIDVAQLQALTDSTQPDLFLVFCPCVQDLAESIEANAPQALPPLLLIESPSQLTGSQTLANEQGYVIPGPVGTHSLKDLIIQLLRENFVERPIEIAGHSHAEPKKEGRPMTEFEALAERLPLRILTAEDSPANQKVIKVMLSKFGYTIDCVSDGKQAVEAVQSEAYHLILMDIQMPVMDGLTASTEILNNDAANVRTPKIVALTASVTPSIQNDCKKIGIVDYLSKPVRPHEIAECIERVFAEKPVPKVGTRF
ncbi:MAG: PAS domain-containing protein [Opitutales bacterium]